MLVISGFAENDDEHKLSKLYASARRQVFEAWDKDEFTVWEKVRQIKCYGVSA